MTRPAWSAITRPSGRSSAHAIELIRTGPGATGPVRPAAPPRASPDPAAPPKAGLWSSALSPGTACPSTRVPASVRHLCRLSWPGPPTRPLASRGPPPPATWLGASGSDPAVRGRPQPELVMTQCDQTLARCGNCAAAPSRVRALCPRRGVQANRGRGGQVKALRLPVYRYRDRLVGQRKKLVRQPPRLVAEQPGRWLGEYSPWFYLVQRLAGPAVRGEHPQARRAELTHRLRHRAAEHHVHMEDAARRGAHALAVVRVDGGVGEDHPGRARRVRGAQHRPRVARVPDIGEYDHQPR